MDNYEEGLGEEGGSTPLLTRGDAPPPALSSRLIASVCVGLIGSAQFGYGVGVMNSPQATIETDLGLPHNDWRWSVIVAAFPVAAAVGAQLSGGPLDSWGRRSFLTLSGILFLIGGGCCIAAHVTKDSSSTGALVLLILARAAYGFATGGLSSACPMYLGEIAPQHLKGLFGALPQLLLTIFIVVSQALGLFLSTPGGWALLLGGVPAALGAAQLLGAPFLVESPTWLAAKGKGAASKTALTLLRGGPSKAVDAEAAGMEAAAAAAATSGSGGWTMSRVLGDALVRKPVFVADMLCVAQQLSGINAVFFFSTSFFTDAGVANSSLGTLAAGATNVAATVASLFLIDRLGRRPLLLLSCGGMVLSSIGITAVLASKTGDTESTAMGTAAVCLVLSFVGSFAIGFGPIPWLIAGEMLPQGPRAIGSSFAAGANWVLTSVVALTFLPVKAALGAYCFMPFMVFVSLTMVFVVFFTPETRGKSSAEVMKYFTVPRGYVSLEQEGRE